MSGRVPRVLFLVSEDWYFRSHRLPLARALKGAGFEVGVACRVSGDGAAIAAEGLELVPLPLARHRLGPLHLAASVARVARAYRAFQPDLVHHVALKPVLVGSLAARLARVPAMVNAVAGLGYAFSAQGPRAQALRAAIGLGLRLVADGPRARLIVQNAEDGEAMVARGIAPRERVVLIPGAGVDLARFRPAPEPPGPVRVTLVARMIREKGIEDLAAAAGILRGRGVPARVTLAGAPDPENPSSIPESRLRAWAGEGVVEYLGPVDDVPALWRESHIACLPSYYGEGVPLALIEAAAAGRPLIAADRPGLRDIARDGETGLLVPPRDPIALADAIARLAADALLRARLGAAARALAEARFGEAAVVAATLAVYRDLLGDRFPRPGP